MLDWTLIGACGLLALGGSLHCAGMCGGFSVLACGAKGTGLERGTRLMAYILGKAVTYVVLAAIIASAAGSLGHLVSHEWSAGAAVAFRRALALSCGLVLILAGLGMFGLHFRVLRISTAWTSSVFAHMRALPGTTGAFAIGASTGLLPCGLSWSALALVSGSDVGTASCGLLVFGLGTGPVLFASGWLGDRARALSQQRVRWFLGLLLILLGGLTCLRADLKWTRGVGLPNCCAESPAFNEQ